MSSLTLRSVRHRFDGATADTLIDIDLGVADGQMLSIVGPSGSGKSTLLRIAAGLESPTSGEVLLDAKPVTHLPPERRDLTVMFQQPHLFTHLDVAGNVAFGPRLAGLGRREGRLCAERYLALVHLDGYGRRRPGQLSGGQQQRVALARALAAERGVMLLDEPFSSLDRELRSSMHSLLGEVRAALSPTIVMVTHDLDEAALAEQTVVLIGGRVHQVGQVADLYRHPATLATARLVGGFNEVPGTALDGRHTSAWGVVPLPSTCAADGPATLLLRREALELVGSDDDGTDAPQAPGVVTRTTRSGPRQTVSVDLDGSRPVRTLEVELPPGLPANVGDRVGVRLRPGSHGWAVPRERVGEPAEPALAP